MKRRFMYIISAVILIFLVFFVVLRVSFPNKNSIDITLPNLSGDESPDDSGAIEVNITSDNIQNIIKTLQPSMGYSRTFSITTYWEGGSNVSTLSMSRRDNQFKISETVNSGIKNILITNNKVYIWYDDLTENIYSADISEFDLSKIDRMARLVSIEGLESIEKDKILEAGYASGFNVPCMYAVYASDAEGIYTNKVYISAVTGLVYAAEVYEGDKLIYEMETLSEDNIAPIDEVFKPPVTK